MTNAEIVRRRLVNQLIAKAGLRRPDDVVAWLGAVQAQEYDPAKWGLALRMRNGAADAEIERAVDQGRILRTHIMRPTWHFVTPADIHWLLELTGPRVKQAMSSYHRKLGLQGDLLVRGISLIERALGNGNHLTRRELGEHLQRGGLTLDGVRLGNLAMCAELEGVICSGPRRAKRSTYALLAERAPKTATLPRDEALAMLSRRYFKSHGPATTRDFSWWSGLTIADAKRGLDINKARREDVGGHTYWTLGPTPPAATRNDLVHLLPIYDEYLIAYRDRVAVPHGLAVVRSKTRTPVTFQHALLIGGQIAGTWRTARSPRTVRIDAIPLRGITRREQRAVVDAAKRYELFLGMPVEVPPMAPTRRR